MQNRASANKSQILDLIRENPFITQQDIADHLQISRSAVANYISNLMEEGLITGRAYVLPQPDRVVCIGGANVDRKIQSIGKLEFATSNPAKTSFSYGGVARNIAENLGRMGYSPTLLTVVGDDDDGHGLFTHCAKCSVDVSQAYQLEDKRTGTYTAVLNPDGSMVLALADMAIYDSFTLERIQSRWLTIASSAICVMDTNLPAEVMTHVIERAASGNVRLCIVPVSAPKARRLPPDLHGVYLLICNKDEAEAIAHTQITDDAELAGACRLIIEKGCQNIIVTLGERGIVWMTDTGIFSSLPATKTTVVDVTGAGDAFAAGVVYSLLRDSENIMKACQLGLMASALTLETTDTVSPELTPNLLKQWHYNTEK